MGGGDVNIASHNTATSLIVDIT
jgi:hypothetical protein